MIAEIRDARVPFFDLPIPVVISRHYNQAQVSSGAAGCEEWQQLAAEGCCLAELVVGADTCQIARYNYEVGFARGGLQIVDVLLWECGTGLGGVTIRFSIPAQRPGRECSKMDIGNVMD